MAMKKAQKAAAHVKSAAKKVATKAAKVAKKVSAKAQPIPAGYHILTPSIVVRGAAEAIEFYKKAFGAKEKYRMGGPGGKIMHAEIKIGDSILMLADEIPEMGNKSPQSYGGSGSSILIYTKNVDALFQQAVAAGAKPVMPVGDQFWGDRYGQVTDPYGHVWQLATRKENLTPKQMAKRAVAAFSGPPPQQS